MEAVTPLMAHNSPKKYMAAQQRKQFYRNRWNLSHPCVYWHEIMTIFPNFTKKSVFRNKRMSTMSFIQYKNSKSAKKHLLQYFMVYCAQSCQNETSIVSNQHSSLHTKLLLQFSGHSSIVLYLFDFLRLRDTRTTTLPGNGNQTPE